MKNVSISYSYSFLKLMITSSAAGAGKSVMQYDNPQMFVLRPHAVG